MKNQKGSTILVLTIMLTVILLYYINSWKNLSLFQDLVIKKYKYEKQLSATEALCNLGIFKCIEDYDLIEKNKAEIIIFQGGWPIEQEDYKGILRVTPQGQTILIEASTEYDNRIFVKVELEKEIIIDPINKNKLLQKFAIKDWQINDL